MGLFSRKDMEELAGKLNQEEDVQNARVVEFLGKPHVHIDHTDDSIGTVDEKGDYRNTPVRKSSRSN